MFDLREMCKDKVLVAAHRGYWMGNIPCNTMMSFRAALKEGADIIELDISRSLDGTLYVFHPGTEPRFLNSKKLIAEMHDDEVKSLCLVNEDMVPTPYRVPLFDDVLEELKGRCIINIDKFPFYPQDIVACVRRHNMVDQALVKTDQGEKYYRMVEEVAPDFAYMTFAWDKDPDVEMLLRRPIHYLGTEAWFHTNESEFATPEYHEKMHRHGLLTWANAIVCNYKNAFSGGHTDDQFTEDREDDGWGFLAGVGFNMIQTDWTAECVQYLKRKGLR